MSNKLAKNDFISHLKYLTLIPLILVLFAIILGFVIGFNTDYSLKNRQAFAVKFYTTVSDAEYQSYESAIKNVLRDNGVSQCRFERTGAFESAGIDVIIPKILDEGAVDNIKVGIEAITPHSNEATISVIDTYTLKPTYITTNILRVLLGVAIACVILFAYMWYRTDIHSAYLSIVSIAISYLLMTTLILIFRIPVNEYITIPYILSTLISLLITTLLFRNIRSKEISDKVDLPNKTLVYNAIADNFRIISTVCVSIFIVLCVLVACAYTSVKFIALACIFAVISTMYSAILIVPALWTKCYNRAKDKRLTKKIEKMNAQNDNKKVDDNNKLVV